MGYKTSDGRNLPLDRAFTLNDISYPANWLRVASADDKAAIGVEWVDAPELKFKDKKYYNNTVSSEGEVTSTPKDLDQIKADRIGYAKLTANARLSGSDWQVIAKAERGREIPEDWAAYRTAVIAECERYEAEVAAADFEGIQKVRENWPLNPVEQAEKDKREAEEQELTNNPQ
tara:strand:+ start:533 stop:1054 length:522 start_codon:yes stop_codon:yes gene_type:complete